MFIKIIFVTLYSLTIIRQHKSKIFQRKRLKNKSKNNRKIT